MGWWAGVGTLYFISFASPIPSLPLSPPARPPGLPISSPPLFFSTLSTPTLSRSDRTLIFPLSHLRPSTPRPSRSRKAAAHVRRKSESMFVPSFLPHSPFHSRFIRHLPSPLFPSFSSPPPPPHSRITRPLIIFRFSPPSSPLFSLSSSPQSFPFAAISVPSSIQTPTQPHEKGGIRGFGVAGYGNWAEGFLFWTGDFSQNLERRRGGDGDTAGGGWQRRGRHSHPPPGPIAMVCGWVFCGRCSALAKAARDWEKGSGHGDAGAAPRRCSQRARDGGNGSMSARTMGHGVWEARGSACEAGGVRCYTGRKQRRNTQAGSVLSVLHMRA